MRGPERRRSAGRLTGGALLDLIHTNNSPNPALARVSGRLALHKRPLFFVGLIHAEDFSLVETLPEAMAIRERLLTTRQGPVILARLVPKGGASAAT